ncbi:MAG: bifunctional phosphopantothenoylcysteine decarboxylase/phosphopantothenate--cysteine ligase CoaBC [Acidobacteriota bacterium]
MSRSPRVLLGVTGGIAAYKAAEIVRRAKSAGAEVRVSLTKSAHAFVSPLTLEVLSGQAVYGEEYLEENGSGDELHIAAAAWADVLCVAPATAHTLARLALGLADDFLTTTALAFSGPLVIAPAMHFEMWEKPAVRQHVADLEARGARLVGPIQGPLASGEFGMGRMADPERIVAAVLAAVAGIAPGPLAGRTVLISAGPTFEPVDPVRFLGNRSSGKMGFAIAAEAALRGARTILVAGPVALATPSGVERIDVETAAEMAAAVAATAPGADLVILAAAVADFRPKVPAGQKIKKDQGVPAFDLEPTEDILAGLSRIAPSAVRVGFAAETERLEENARGKLIRKDVHFIVANDVSRGDIAFGRDENEVLVLPRDGEPVAIPRQGKARVAAALLDLFTPALGAAAVRR